jgi:TRAP-type C4-dicarboxylate transport system permease small subunit
LLKVWCVGMVKFFAKAIGGLGPFGGVLIVVIAFLAAWNIIGRRFFLAPIEWAPDVSEYLLLACVFLVLPLSWREDKHVRVDILYRRLGDKWRARANLFFSFWALIFTAGLVWYGFWEAWRAFRVGEFSSTITVIPTFPAKAVIPFGAFLLCLQIVNSALRGWKTERGRRQKAPEDTHTSACN